MGRLENGVIVLNDNSIDELKIKFSYRIPFFLSCDFDLRDLVPLLCKTREGVRG